MVNLLSLPPELLAIIVGYLPRSTVASLTRANSVGYRLFCSYLYHSVWNALSTLSRPQNKRKLSHDLPHPASYVLEWHININLGIKSYDPESKELERRRVVHTAICQSLQNILDRGGKLRRLEYSSIDLSFHDAFQNTCLKKIPLETLALEGMVGKESHVGDSTLTNILGQAMTRLKLKIWMTGGDSFTDDMSSTICKIPTLCPNLSTLAIDFRLQPKAPVIDALLDLQIPGLRSLLIGYVCYSNRQIMDPRTVLQHNPNIEHLALPLAKATILPDLVQSLTTFEGSYDDCAQILMVQPLITTLKIDLKMSSIFAERSPDYEEEKRLLTGLRGASYLAHLAVVHNDLCEGGWASEHGVSRECFEQIVNACPKLKRFECLLRPTQDIADVCPKVIDTLGLLKQLKLYIYQHYNQADYEQGSTSSSESGSDSQSDDRSSGYDSGSGHEYGNESDNNADDTSDRLDPNDMKQKRLENFAFQIAKYLAPALPCLRTVDLEVRGYDHDDWEADDDTPHYEDSFTYDILPPRTDGSRTVLGDFKDKTRICLGADGEGKLLWKEQWGVTARESRSALIS